MHMLRRLRVAIANAVLLTVAICAPLQAAHAQVAVQPLVLVPYEEPGSKDPHAAGVTQALTAALRDRGVAVTAIPALDHIEAVTHAAQLCRDNGAGALLIPEGRYEQNRRTGYGPFGMRVLSYPAHVEFRLDEIGCDASVVWSATSVGDKSVSGVGMNLVGNANLGGPANVTAVIDDAFRAAIATVAASFKSAAPAAPSVIPSTPATLASSAAQRPASFALLPFAQPGIADPRSKDMSGALLKAMNDRGVHTVLVEPMDRLSVVASAARLCARSGAGAIAVPEVRVEQTEHTFADLRIASIGCDGRLLSTASGTANVGNGGTNAAAAMVEATEKAGNAALDQLLGTQKT